MFLFAAGVSFVADYSCKKAVTDIVVYKSMDRITDAVFEVYDDLPSEKIDAVFDFIEENSDLRKIAEIYVEAALREAGTSETESETLDGMLDSAHSEEMQQLASDFTDDLVEFVTGTNEDSRSGIENRLYDILKTALSENVTNSVSVYAAGVINDMSSQQRTLVKLYTILMSTAAKFILTALAAFNARLVFAAGGKSRGNVSGSIISLGIATVVSGIIMLLVSRTAVSAGAHITNRLLGRSVLLDVQNWYIFGGVCAAAGILAVILGFVFKGNTGNGGKNG